MFILTDNIYCNNLIHGMKLYGLAEIECEGVVWIQLAQDRVQWWTVVDTVMNFDFHERWGIY
jgi:hypothetical protein